MVSHSYALIDEPRLYAIMSGDNLIHVIYNPFSLITPGTGHHLSAIRLVSANQRSSIQLIRDDFELIQAVVLF